MKRITIDVSENGLMQIKSDEYNFDYLYDDGNLKSLYNILEELSDKYNDVSL